MLGSTVEEEEEVEEEPSEEEEEKNVAPRNSNIHYSNNRNMMKQMKSVKSMNSMIRRRSTIKNVSNKKNKSFSHKNNSIMYTAHLLDQYGQGQDENGETSYRSFAISDEKRLKILIGFYVRNCGSHRITLGLQMFMMQRYVSIN